MAGRDVLITGCGPIGLMNVAVARVLGAAQVIATDVNPKRLAEAKRLGADRVIDVNREEPVTIVRDMTAGRGADVVFEYSGQAKALTQAVEALTSGGDPRRPHGMDPEGDHRAQHSRQKDLCELGTSEPTGGVEQGRSRPARQPPLAAA